MRRHALLGSVSLVACVAAAAPAARAAGPAFRSLSQSLAARASAYATSVGGSAAATQAGSQAALGIRNLQVAAARFQSLQATLAARATPGQDGAGVPNGVVAGGLVPATGYDQPGATVWQGVSATAPLTETASGGTTTVTVNQAKPQAILNWQSFNVGAHTHLVFNQSAGGVGASGWTVLNRIENPSTAPSQIFGAISAQGQVLVLNSSGVLFGAGSQVSLHSLVAGAATLADTAFLKTGFILPSNTATLTSTFTGTAGSITVQAGAVIATLPPASATDGGGSVILLGRTVTNDGLISTPSGQTILAAGSSYALEAGYSVPAGSATPAAGTCPTPSDCATVLGAQVDVVGRGSVTNDGLIVATTGDITLAGQTIVQGGGLFATTATNQRGTVHLVSDTLGLTRTPVLDPKASITLAPEGVIAITPDPNSAAASDGQRRDTAESGDYLSNPAPLPDQPDRSRIEISTAGTITFAPNSLTLATGGQIAVAAGNGDAVKGNPATSGQVFIAGGATLDVSGLNNVALAMSTNEIAVNVQGFQLRDAPLARDAGTLFNSTIELDVRTLAYVAPSVVDNQARDYSPGGLLEVSGDVSAQQRTIQEWSAVGGTVTLAGASVVAQPGAVVNIAGGSLAYSGGYLQQSYLIGPGGTLYNASTAPADIAYTGIYDGFVVDHARWETLDRFFNPMLYPAEIYEPGYRVGRDAGALSLRTPTALFEGTVAGGVETDPIQVAARSGSAADPVLVAQDVVPQAGTLSLQGPPIGNLTVTNAPTKVVIAATTPSTAATLTAGGRVPGADVNTAIFGASQLDGLGGLSITVGPMLSTGFRNAGSIEVDGPVTLAPGGTVTLSAPTVTVLAGITARSGGVTLQTEMPGGGAFSNLERGTLSVAPGVVIDTRGEFSSTVSGTLDLQAAAFVNGGAVTLLSDGGLQTGAGSVIDASAGGVFTGALSGGHGGNVTLVGDDPALASLFTGRAATLAPVIIAGTERSLGVSAGGTVTLTAPSILIGNAPSASSTLQVALPASFFASGFSDYVLDGFATPGPIPKRLAAGEAEGVVVEPETRLSLVEPVLAIGPATASAADGADPEAALSATLLPQYVLNTVNATTHQRAGASLTLSSSAGAAGIAPVPEAGSGITVGEGAVISADTGRSVTLSSPSQITVDGTIRAPSGTISVQSTANAASNVDPVGFGRSIWIGPQATLDVSGVAVTGTAQDGRPFGQVTGGGTILLGATGDVNAIENEGAAAAYVLVRPGAVLKADGAQAVLDLYAGEDAPAAPRLVASDGGTISVASDFGIYLDGTMSAQAGGVGALGGELALRLGDPGYGASNKTTTYPNWALTPHQIVVSQDTMSTPLTAGLQPGDGSFAQHDGANGQAAISAQQVAAGGFADLFLLALDQITFNGNVSLATTRSITLADFATSETSRSATVHVAAPYVLLAGASQPDYSEVAATPLLTFDNSNNNVGNDGRPFSQVPPCISGVAACTASSFAVTADLIDIESSPLGVGGVVTLLNAVTFNGAYASIYGGHTLQPLDSFGYNDVTLTSTGDIRFAAAPAAPPAAVGSQAVGQTFQTDQLVTAGDLTLDAARIYPVTDVSASVYAGVNYWTATDKDQGALALNALFYGGALKLGRTTTGTPAAPLSAYGRIDLQAATVEQGGVVQAPLGIVAFGPNAIVSADILIQRKLKNGVETIPTDILAVNLLAGSVTSVSADGVTIPFGGTTDGTSYSYNGQVLTPVAASLGSVGNRSAGIVFDANQVSGAAGSVIDLSGGGTLSGGGGELLSGGGTSLLSQGFIPGRGGSADTLVTPFLVASGGGVSQPTIGTDPIYAILPGYTASYAPTSTLDVSTGYYGSQPTIGETVTIGAALPGLPAGTYTLLPSYYALLQGAYRVQLDGAGAVAGSLAAPVSAPTVAGVDTVAETVTLGTANTGARSYPVVAEITTGAGVRGYSTYDEEDFASYATQNAALFGNARPFLPQDAGDLLLTLSAPSYFVRKHGTPPPPVILPVGLTFAGTTEDAPAAGGYGAIVSVQPTAGASLEVLGPGAQAPAGVVSAEATALDALRPAALLVGGTLTFVGSASPTAPGNDTAGTVTIGSGAVLSADTILAFATGTVEIDAGATLTALGQAALLPDSTSGELFSNGGAAFVAISNADFIINPGASAASTGTIVPTVDIVGCMAGAACAPTVLAADRYVGLFWPQLLTVGTDVAVGAPTLTLASSAITLEGADATETAPSGLVLSQGKIGALLAGGQGAGIPAVSSLQLDATSALVLDGDVALDLSASSASTLVLSTPAILGLGAASDTATLRDGTVVWTGVAAGVTPPPVAGAPGTGQGTLAIAADNLVLGYTALSQPQDQVALSDTVLGFSSVALTGTASVSGNNRSTLTVYQSATTTGTGTTQAGGDLLITTPLLTTAPGAVLGITAGGTVTLAGTGAAPGAAGGLGGEIDITAASLVDGPTVLANQVPTEIPGTAVDLPGGRFAVNASGDVVLTHGASIDVAGPVVSFFSVQRGTPGGDVLLTSTTGGIDLDASSRVDVSAADAAAGTLAVVAPAGTVTLDGALAGTAPSAGQSGSVAVTGTSLGDFAALNTTLDAGGFGGGRTFEQTGPGSLMVTGTITAHTIGIAVDGGSLTVDGTLDASGIDPGTIRLAASGDLTLGSAAVLDLRETVPHTDYFGELITAENVPHAELSVASNTAAPGTLTLSPGAAILMAGPGGLALGDLELDVPRTAGTANANIAAGGAITVTGAGTIAVNAFRTYTPGGMDGAVPQSGTLTQADFNAIDADSQAFMTGAVSGGALAGPLASELAGLAVPYASVFHLRPGVEIDSSAASGGDLSISGEVDLSEYRYASVNPTTQKVASVYGSGEPGVLWLRAADDLTVAGSLTDGFAPTGSVTTRVGHGKHRHTETLTSVSLAPLLAAGDLSWSMRLAAGADLGAADSRTVQTAAALAGQATTSDPTPGSLLLSDAHKLSRGTKGEDISFVRTGTGSLELLAGGNFSEASAFGVYTAGMQAAGAPNAADHYFATGGGDVLLQAGGNVGGYLFNAENGDSSDQMSLWLLHDSKSWWLNFASYSKSYGITGFTGIGALAGGNVTIDAGLDAGTNGGTQTTTGLQLVDTTTGYRADDGTVTNFGGGDTSIVVAHALNPVAPNIPSQFSLGSDDAFGLIADLRGNIAVSAGTVGRVVSVFAPGVTDPRAYDPFVPGSGYSTAGPVLVVGDTLATVDTRSDLAIAGVGDSSNNPFKFVSDEFSFSFYKPTSSLVLFSAGGNVAPIGDQAGTNDGIVSGAFSYATAYYPGRLDVTAAAGNVYFLGKSGLEENLELAPSSVGSLVVLAAGSILDEPTTALNSIDPGNLQLSLHIEMSGALPETASELPGNLFAAGGTKNFVDSAVGTLHAGDDTAALFFASSGDIVGLQTGAVLTGPSRSLEYLGATAVQMEAGRDIVSTGGSIYVNSSSGSLQGNPADFFLDNNATDVSSVVAGRDIIYANVDIAGPGTLVVQAGRNVYQGDAGILESVGEIGSALTAATRDSGAGITVLAGLDGGTDFSGFASLYLNAAHLANPTTPLQDQPGKVERTYQTQLYAWLLARGYTGTEDGALAYFLTLPQTQQETFLLSVYFAELNQSGLDYNDPTSRFYHSYLEGQDALRALFPATDPTGQSAPAGGSLTLFSGETLQGSAENLFDSAIRTDFGGGITTVVPYGQTVLGNYGIVPQPSAGILTEGTGNVDMYSYGSVTLGQSRVLTTFGGDILIWLSSDGEINAGRGAKNTILIPPVGISYDDLGNIVLSPTTPSSGAGIATLAPIPSVPAGDINLIAPFGTIDAGEAGIRSSGNVNVAALTVVNSANIASGGKTSGVPTVSVASISTVAAASGTAGAATQAAQNTQAQHSPVAEPSVVDVDIISIGSGDTRNRRKREG